MKERLQKIIARAGIASRRASEELILAGRVTVNGATAELGMKADPDRDHILVDGKRVSNPEPLRYVALNKPRNVISTVTSPDPRPTVRDLVSLEGRLYPVGRLDIESEGLVLLTNDGDLANRITHPRFGCEKEYRALVPRSPDEKQLTAWRSGVVLEDGHRTAPARVKIESVAPRGTWLRIVMKEGRKRQIREIGDQLGLPVIRLLRVRIGTLLLGTLKPRQWRELTSREVTELKSSIEGFEGRSRGRSGKTNRRKPKNK